MNPMNGATPTTSTAHRPYPWASNALRIFAAEASLSTRDRQAGKCSRTRGSALSAANGGRSSSRQGRRTRRSVRSTPGSPTLGSIANGTRSRQLDVGGGRSGGGRGADHAVPALGLAGVEGVVGLLEAGVDAHRPIEHGDAEGEGDAVAEAGGVGEARLDDRAQPVGDLAGGRHVGLGEEQQELLAAPAGDGVPGAEALAEQGR